MESFARDGLVFDVLDSGPAGGDVVVLLHGFPQFADSWNAVTPALAAGGYRCLAPNQRGYSAGARPQGRRAYRIGELVEDVVALIDASGARRAHVVGHDWGAAVAWAVAVRHPDRLVSLTALSVPHPAAFVRALVTSRQVLASWYMYFFQLPWLPERIMLGRSGRDGRRLARFLVRSRQSPEVAERDARAMIETDAFTSAVNWYRAMFLSSPRAVEVKVSVPTLYVWSEQDTALLRKGAEATRNWVTGPYRFEVFPGVTHWIMDELPDKTATLLLEHFTAHPA